MCQDNGTVTDELRIVHITCSLTIILFGTLGNVMSIVLICRSKLYRASPFMMLIIDLCLANSVSTAFILPLVTASIFYQQWPLGDVFCQAFAYIMYVALTAECFVLTNLIVCQYLVVVHRVAIKTILLQGRKHIRLCAILGLPWIGTSCAFLVPLTKFWDEFGYDQRSGYCTLINKQNGLGFQAAGSITLIATMTVVTFYCYSAILYIHCRSDRRKSRRLQNISVLVGCSRKVELMVTTILLNYLFTYLPFLITCVADPCHTVVPKSIYTTIIYICWSHTAINPVIYALFNTKIRVLWQDVFKSSSVHNLAG